MALGYTDLASTVITGQPLIAFKYSAEAIRKGLELSSYLLPLKGDPLRKNFPTQQMGLPSHIYDASPDGWVCSRILVAIQSIITYIPTL